MCSEEETAQKETSTEPLDTCQDDFPDLEGIDVRTGLQRLLGNAATYRRTLLLFRNDFANVDERLKDLELKGSFEEAQRLVHTVKGSAGNIGAERLQGRAAELESWYGTAQRKASRSKFDNFSAELNKVLLSLSELRESGRNASVTTSKQPFSEKDRKNLADSIDTIVNLLNKGDTGALGMIAEVSKALEGRVGIEKLQKMQQLIERWEFDAAARCLSDCAKEAGIDLASQRRSGV